MLRKHKLLQSRLESINKSCKLDKFENVTDKLSSYNAKRGECKTILIERKKFVIPPRLKKQSYHYFEGKNEIFISFARQCPIIRKSCTLPSFDTGSTNQTVGTVTFSIGGTVSNPYGGVFAKIFKA